MKKCWCGKRHGKGGALNGDLKHFALNWKLYQLRHKDGEVKEKAEIPAPELVAVA